MAHFSTAWKAFWAILHSDSMAHAWTALQSTNGRPAPELPAAAAPDNSPAAEPPSAPKQPAATTQQGEAVHTLALLQREARLIDFLKEDISPYSNEQIGIAVRKIHDDAKKVLDTYFKIVPVRPEEEGTTVTLTEGYDKRHVQLSGKTAGEPPVRGIVIHRGWKAESLNLPTRSHAVDPAIICPAEIEIN